MSDTGVRRLVRLVSVISAVEVGYILVVAILFFGGPSDPESETGSWGDVAGNALVIGSLLVLGSAVIRLTSVWLSDDPRVPRWTMLAVLAVNAVAVVAGVWAGLSELGSGDYAWWTAFTLITAATAGIAVFLLASTRGSERSLLMD